MMQKLLADTAVTKPKTQSPQQQQQQQQPRGFFFVVVVVAGVLVFLVFGQFPIRTTDVISRDDDASSAGRSEKSPTPARPDIRGILDAIPLFPDGQVPDEAELPPIGPEVTIEGDDGVARVYNVSVPTLTPFLLPSATAAVVVFPGGGYVDLSIDAEGDDVAAKCNELGLSAFVLKYRVPARPALPGLPKWWAPLQDAQRAVSVVRSLYYPSVPVGVLGFSAGGNLAAHLSTAWEPKIYDRLDAIDDAPSRPDFAGLIYPWELVEDDDDDGAYPALAPEVANVTADTPPAFLVHAEDDPTAPFANSLAYFQALARAELDAGRHPVSRLEIDPDGGHGFGLCEDDVSYLNYSPEQHKPSATKDLSSSSSSSVLPIVCEWPDRWHEWLETTGVLPAAVTSQQWRSQSRKQ